tara:strand:+ start:1238 stop:1516 length:279 start_codon:yes stop_codon:yes gene_type:complete
MAFFTRQCLLLCGRTRDLSAFRHFNTQCHTPSGSQFLFIYPTQHSAILDNPQWALEGEVSEDKAKFVLNKKGKLVKKKKAKKSGKIVNVSYR